MIVNYTGGDTWVPSLRALRLYGRMLTCGATAGFDPKTDIRFIWRRQASIIGSDGWTRDDITALLDQVRWAPLGEGMPRDLEDRPRVGPLHVRAVVQLGPERRVRGQVVAHVLGVGLLEQH